MKPATRVLTGIVATLAIAGGAVLLTAGRGESRDERPRAKAPRPVSVLALVQTRPEHAKTMTGAVSSWKTEKIGFEIPGRVEQVIEPDTDIEGRIHDSSDHVTLTEGTVLARLDDTRYRIAEEAAQAAVDVARSKMEAIQVDIEYGFVARIDVAKLEEKLAKVEFDRAKNLIAKSVVSQSEYDHLETSYETAKAKALTLKAEQAAKRAELRSLEAQVNQAVQQLEEAKRDLRDATLYSSFRGQTAQVHVVPGSYVTAGEPVLTIQMMDPIKVELELSATMSRRFRHGDSVRLYGTDIAERPIPLSGFVYMADPVADTDTRTFTVTLLVRNQKLQPSIPSGTDGQPPARTKDIWPLNIEPIVGGGVALMVEARAVQHDSDGAFLWKVTNRHIGDVSTDASRMLNVTRVRVTPGDRTIPFLGNWNFVPITVNEGETLDPKRDLVAGEITVEDGDGQSWDGDQILLDRSGWLLRPGDLVRIDLPNGDTPLGYYVPVKAIRNESGRTSVFVADQSQSAQVVARQIEVRLADTAYVNGGEQVLRRIEPIGAETFADGARLITEGVHYLVDNETVAVVDQQEYAQ